MTNDSRTPTDADKVTEFLKSYCDTIRLVSDTGTELKYKLLDSSKIPGLLTALNEKKHEYAIKDFGVSLISLEDVYLR